MKPAVWLRLVFVSTVLFALGCGSTPPPPTPEAVKSEIDQLNENRERERMNK